MSTTSTGGKHPKGLYVLFFTEMWERFGYYLMLGIFSLYMIDSWEAGGMGFDSKTKSDIFGTYIGLVYLTPFIGGLLADRILGYRRSIVIGGLLMSAGYFGLSLHTENSFYLSLLLIIIGNGFFKPNISTLVGNLYNNEKYKANKDAGFNIFYMGINIGAFACNFVAAFARHTFGWGGAFVAAGIGMLLGLIIFMIGTRHVREADVIKPTKPGDLSIGAIFGAVLLPMLGFGAIGYFLKGVTGPDNPNGNFFGTDTNDAFLIGCIPVIAFFIFLMVSAKGEDKRPIAALLSVYACIVVFWAVFHQNGDALTVWAEDHTNREVPAFASGPAETLRLTQKATYHESVLYPDEKFHAYIDSLALVKEKYSNEKNVEKVRETRELIEEREVSRKYFKNLPREEWPEKDKSLILASTEIYQSINPFWVIILTPVVVGFFGFMRARKREPSTPAKITMGLVITALSALVMVAAVKATNMESDKASSWWLFFAYGVITVGELCLSPMGLSLVSKLSPPRLTALMMGGFFLSTSVGNKLAGVLSGMWEGFEDKSYFFLMNFGLVMAAALLLFVQLRWLNGVMKEKGLH